MGRSSSNPKKFIISFRVNDREMRALHERAQKSGVSITRLMRQSLDLPAQQQLSSNSLVTDLPAVH